MQHRGRQPRDADRLRLARPPMLDAIGDPTIKVRAVAGAQLLI